MKNPPIPENEPERLAALREYAILDTGPEEAFDDIARLAAQTCGAPIALITFVDDTRQWHKSRIGWDASEAPRASSLCARAILQREIFVIENAPADARFAVHPSPGTDPGIQFYAGAPLVTPDGHALGTLCVMDYTPRRLTKQQNQALRALGRQVVAQLELRLRIARQKARQEETEYALRETEAFYHSLVESLPQNIFRKNLRGQFTFANQRFCATLGREFSEIIGKTDADLFPPELALKYQKDDRRVIETLQACETVEAHQSSDGEKIYVQVIKTPLYGSNGVIAGVQGIFWDVTERKRIEEDLARERDLLRSLLDNIPDSIYFKDTDSRFIKISKAMASNLGLANPEEAVGKTDFDFFPRSHAVGAFRDEQKIIATGEPIIAKIERETLPTRPDAWMLTTKVPFRSKHGVTVGTLGISRDISELKKTEVELALARDAALESARLKSEFLANMSHEIRTPMNAIIGMTGLVLDTELTEEQRDFACTIRNSADSLLDIINDILDFSKIEAGKLAIELIDFDLDELVEGAVDVLAEKSSAKGLELVQWVDERVSRHLRGDPGRVRQVLTNLIGNAVKFTEKGDVFVSVACEHESETQCLLKFSVRDTGIGIALEAQPRIFESFTQADGSMTRRYGGTGLGLAISRQLVELMRGSIGFESAPGRGSTFWFTLPFEKQGGRAPSRPPAAAATLEGLRVLVVDDNATNRQIVHHQVVSWKMRNGSVDCGPDALALLRREALAGDPYDLAILDMQMPGMDGLTLARSIQADPLTRGTRVIILSSMGQQLDAATLHSAGVAACLLKPVKPSRLFDCLATVAGSARAPAPRPAPPTAQPATPPSPETQARHRSVRILLAEDNSVNQKVALRQLQKLGYNADAVANGLEALAALEQAPYDIVLMDCQMPEMDGYDTTRHIREQERLRARRPGARPQYIIAMTANALTGDREECLNAGMNDYISKPVRLDELEAALEKGAAAARSAIPAAPSADEPPVDLEALEALRALRLDGEPDPLAELIDLFLQDTPERLHRIAAAVEQRDAEALEAAAHSLKGSASNLGAIILADHCAVLLRLARARTVEEAADCASQVRAEFKRVQAALENIKANPGALASARPETNPA